MATRSSRAMTLTSGGFAQGETIPARYTCDGEDLSPPLAWIGAPRGTLSFALVCHDPDAPSGDWYHWAAYDIPADASALAEGALPGRDSFREAINDFGRRGYGGPCPPQGHGRHHYRFTLYALDVARLDVPASARCRAVARAAAAHTLVTAELVGTYSRT